MDTMLGVLSSDNTSSTFEPFVYATQTLYALSALPLRLEVLPSARTREDADHHGAGGQKGG